MTNSKSPQPDGVSRGELIAMISISVTVTGGVAAILVAVMVLMFQSLDDRMNSLQQQVNSHPTPTAAAVTETPTPSAQSTPTPQVTHTRYAGEGGVIGPQYEGDTIACDDGADRRYHDSELVAAVPSNLLGSEIPCFADLRVCAPDSGITQCVVVKAVTSFSAEVNPDRVVNLSTAAATEIGIQGRADVEVEVIGKS